MTWPAARLILLDKASQRWADSAQDSEIRLAERLMDNDPRKYFVYYMLGNDAYPLYGQKRWSERWHLIAESERRQGQLKEGALIGLSSKEVMYESIAMRAKDYLEVKKGLRREIQSLPGE